MSGTVLNVYLEKTLEQISSGSFNNDSEIDDRRNAFRESIPDFDFWSSNNHKVLPQYLQPNVHHYNSDLIYQVGKTIVVGEYCNNGVIVPRDDFTIAFNRLYNCTPLISRIKGEKEYISFLHTWAETSNLGLVDTQVRHWMKTVSKFGDVVETVFAPRKGASSDDDTEYITAITDIQDISKNVIVLTRPISELRGIVNSQGVYFAECGYHLWET